MALVEKLISDLDKPRGECIIDVMVMEVSSSYMRTLSTGGIGATGMTTSAVFAPRPGITTPGIQSSSSSSPLDDRNHHDDREHDHRRHDHGNHTALPAAVP